MFSREYEIVRLLAHDAKRLWPDMVGELVLRAERGYGRGVADLVVLDIDHANLLERRNCGLPPARRAGEAVVLEAVIAKAGEPLETILSAIPMTRSHARRLMSQLADVGLVQVEDGAAFPAWPGAPIAARVVAIEAKLANWRGGAIQADRYLAGKGRINCRELPMSSPYSASSSQRRTAGIRGRTTGAGTAIEHSPSDTAIRPRSSPSSRSGCLSSVSILSVGIARYASSAKAR